MRILAVSDLHLDGAAAERLLARAEDADLVLGAGDFASRREGLDEYMRRLEPIAAKSVLIPGNNESLDELRAATSAAVLHGDSLDRGEVTIVGLGGGVPPLGLAPFESWDLTEAEAEAALARFERCDILLCHSPPAGVADVIRGHGAVGSTALRQAAERLQPKLMLFGHVHDCWGQEGRIGTTLCRNLGPEGAEFVL